MASQSQIKTYLAYWFQLGKKVLIPKQQRALLPQSILEGDRYSQEFEHCWQKILASQGKNCYLEGTNQTLEELFSSSWDIISCARCEMPIPIVESGIQPIECPCSDLPEWPNLELPSPRSPVNTSEHLGKLRNRLQK